MVTHVPERTCVGCRARSAKRELLRLVRADDGAVRIDIGGRAAGRGAYVHPSDACVERALRAGAIAWALRIGVAAEEARKLRGLTGRMQGNA